MGRASGFSFSLLLLEGFVLAHVGAGQGRLDIRWFLTLEIVSLICG